MELLIEKAANGYIVYEHVRDGFIVPKSEYFVFNEINDAFDYIQGKMIDNKKVVKEND